ncbi:hypothetical protein LJY25_06375 [Hymenobacter sp. BT175]|uniref:hypothetical protein n=1 Tax=Hymenobacter translucens TaxID=2886507 RepID=UPI001D0DDFA0|nr:hypothetical protein [Hymenobacter translucens]MCC2546064.1 hypothetical protein [Hymenobacter translucens]
MRLSSPFAPVQGLLLTVLVASGLSACSTGRASIAVSAQLAQTAPLPVSGRQGWQWRPTYRFGDFAATDIRKGWLSTSAQGAPFLMPDWLSRSRARQKFSFALQPPGGAPAWAVRGAYFAHGSSFTPPGTGISIGLGSEEVYTSIIQVPGRRPWQLVVERSQGFAQLNPATGALTNGDTTLQVRPISRLLRLDGKVMTLPGYVPLGYEFVLADGQVIGAVETMGAGRVWLAPALNSSLRPAVAAAATALLLKEE